MKRTERLLKLAMCKHSPKKRKCNKYKTSVPLRMLQASPVPPGSEEEIQYLMDVLDDDSLLINKTSGEGKENRKKLSETSSKNNCMDASTSTQAANVSNPAQAADISIPAQAAYDFTPAQAANVNIPSQAADFSIHVQAAEVSVSSQVADASITPQAVDVNIPSQATDVSIHVQAANVSDPTQVADTSITPQAAYDFTPAQAANVNIPSQAADFSIHVQAAEVSVSSQVADASITPQAVDVNIPSQATDVSIHVQAANVSDPTQVADTSITPQAAYDFTPAQAANVNIPSQAADFSIHVQAAEVSVSSQVADASITPQAVDVNIPSQATDVSIHVQAANVSDPTQVADTSITPQAAYDFTPAQAANVNIPSQAADFSIHVQAAEVSVSSQVADASITPQAVDVNIPSQATDVSIHVQATNVSDPTQVADTSITAQAVDVNIPSQSIDVSIHVQAANVSDPTQVTDHSITAQAADVNIPSQADDFPSGAQSADIENEDQLDFPLDFAISTPEVLNLISPLPNLPSVTSISERFSDSSMNSTPRSRMATKKKDKGRLRCTYKSEWKDIKKKLLKNSGKSYSSRDGTVRPRKEIKPPCTCKKNCAQKIAQEQRKEIFENFWNLSDHTRQWDFIAKFARSSLPKRIKSEAPNRSQTVSYYLPTSVENGEELVCRTMFLNTLSISEKTVRTALKKFKEGNGYIEPDQRGVHLNRPLKILQSTRQSSIDHVTSLVPVESHYCRKRTSKLNLDGNLDFARLYKLYKEWYEKNQEKYEKPATQRQYHDTVNENFNIEFYAPKKDLCDTCHVYDNLNNPTNEEKKNYEKHIDRKKLARNIKDKDKEAAIGSNGKIVTGCFDLQKVLTCPHGNVSIFYYKRKLSLYNFTVFDMAEKSGFCYMWQEVTGKKGANEISSGLFIFIVRKVESGVKEFRFWSDNCSGQNRNRIVFAMYQYMVMNHNVESITHRFLEVGHTQTEGDNMHSVIERASKDKMVYTAEQWYNLIRWAKSSGPPYSVQELTQEDIKDFKSLLDGRNWVKNDNNEKVIWSQVKEIHINNENSHVVHYKYELDSPEYLSITTIKKTRSRKTIINAVHRAYESPLAISKDKYRDLIGLCQAKIIPEEFHRFFMTLKYNEEGIGFESADDEA